jgi:hypothetical protein
VPPILKLCKAGTDDANGYKSLNPKYYENYPETNPKNEINRSQTFFFIEIGLHGYQKIPLD